jgi:hypothetical protein
MEKEKPMLFKRLVGVLLLSVLFGANYQTENFIVTASDEKTAQQMAVAAETERTRIGMYWFGAELLRWQSPCRIKHYAGRRPVGGLTDTLPGRVEAVIYLYGPYAEISGNVLPHELCHVIMRAELDGLAYDWAEEGAAIAMESAANQALLLEEARAYVRHGGRYSLRWMFSASLQYDPLTAAEIYRFYRQAAAYSAWLLEKDPGHFLAVMRQIDHRSPALSFSRELGYSSVEECERAMESWLLDQPAPSTLTPVTLAQP